MNRTQRRVSLAVTAISVISGIAAAWFVGDLLSAQHRRFGPLVRVPVAVTPIARGTRVDDAVLAASVADRSVPRLFAPAGAVKSPQDLLGAVAAVDIPRGEFLTSADFPSSNDTAGPGFKLRPGERAVTVDALIAPNGADPPPGGQIDLLASGIGGGSDTELVITHAEVLAIGDAGGGSAAPRKRITLRVSVRQLPRVIRADTFAKEVQAVIVP